MTIETVEKQMNTIVQTAKKTQLTGKEVNTPLLCLSHSRVLPLTLYLLFRLSLSYISSLAGTVHECITIKFCPSLPLGTHVNRVTPEFVVAGGSACSDIDGSPSYGIPETQATQEVASAE